MLGSKGAYMSAVARRMVSFKQSNNRLPVQPMHSPVGKANVSFCLVYVHQNGAKSMNSTPIPACCTGVGTGDSCCASFAFMLAEVRVGSNNRALP